VLGQPAQPVLRRVEPENTEAQAVPLERAALDEHVERVTVGAHGQLLGNVVDDPLVGGGRRRQHRNPGW
jgi:hypothetical protein